MPSGNGSECPPTSGQEASLKNTCNIWADGCYDLSHFGHANSFRQAKSLGDFLTVGVHSDAEIMEHKSTAPVFTQEERYAMVRAVKWVDKVVEAAPYVTTLQTLDDYNCQFCAHGDDITTTADGNDTYQAVKDTGRYKEVKRTQGVSTTELINRMLAISKISETKSINHNLNHDLNNNDVKELAGPESESESSQVNGNAKKSPWTGRTKFFLTIDKINNFSYNTPPCETDTVVYVAGAFDLLHPGHLQFLERAKKLGTYLIVGIHDDPTVNLCSGSSYPVMTLNERLLTLLGCRYVNDVVIGAPLQITGELLDHFNVSVVAHGKIGTSQHPSTAQDLFEIPRKRGIFQEIDSGSTLTTQQIVARVDGCRAEYKERNRKKEEKEANIIKSQSADLQQMK